MGAKSKSKVSGLHRQIKRARAELKDLDQAGAGDLIMCVGGVVWLVCFHKDELPYMVTDGHKRRIWSTAKMRPDFSIEPHPVCSGDLNQRFGVFARRFLDQVSGYRANYLAVQDDIDKQGEEEQRQLQEASAIMIRASKKLARRERK